MASIMTYEGIKRYFRFLSSNRPTYLKFNKQLLVGELAGFGMGIVVAEAVANLVTRDEFTISTSSSIADYGGSIAGFLAIFYHNNKSLYKELSSKDRIKKILRDAFGLWPSIAIADIAYIFARPYFHYIMLVMGLEAGVAATIAHFLAFGVFNGVAILSRSIIDYTRQSKKKQV